MIRKATCLDSTYIANLIISGWKTAYKGLIDDTFLNNMPEDSIKNRWLQTVKNQNSSDNVYVCEEDNKILGVIRFGDPVDSNSKFDSEVLALYVEPNLKGNGIGTKLLNFAKEYFIKNNKTNMVIWCLNNNIPSMKFYEKRGGKAFGTRRTIINNIELEEIGFEYNLNN